MELQLIRNRDEATELIAFFLAAGMFATPLTPGELQVIRNNPYESLVRQTSAYWVGRDATGRLTAGLGIREHANQTGIYELTCIAVSPESRQRGLGVKMLETALRYVERLGGRGMLVDTSDHAGYASMCKLLQRCGFTRIGHLPEFYYPGEGMYLYYRLLGRKASA
jgi:ribosomal protein S18 acetylase RimI-like enzyme